MIEGQDWINNYAGTPKEKVIIDMAVYLYWNTVIVPLGFPCEVPMWNELDDDTKQVYIKAAEFSYNLVIWSKPNEVS